MPLRKGNVEAVPADQQDVSTPPFEPDAPPPPAPAAATPPPPPAPESTAPVDQHAAAAAAAQMAAPAVAPQTGVTQMPAERTAGANAMQAAGHGGVANELDAQGFEGLEFGFGSFPIITLQNTGRFESSDGGDMGTSFQCIVLGSKPKWVYKNGAPKQQEDYFYTFDQQTTLGGERVADVLARWQAAGWTPEVKKYLDVQAQLVTNDQDNGTLVLLSIPPTSIPRFSGYLATLRQRNNASPSEVVTTVQLGDKVTKAKHPFHPWAFNFAAKLS
jgi:hypothetical protein